MSLTIISVDTGNKNIKTSNTQPFNSGLICHGTSAPPLSVETLRYDGKYYSLTEKRIPTMFDKTETEDFYILTLFAAAKEIAAQDGPKPAYRKDICLALGLPPTHLQELKPKYLKYFGRGGQRIEFTYNGTHYDLRVARVEVFPQGYAAVVPYLGKIRDKTRSYTELHYRIIQSTQDILPVKDILNGVVITKDGRYVKLLEFKPVNFMYVEPESQERLISTFASMLQAVSVNIQFKAISKKADVESMISTVKEIHDKETDERRQKMLEAYIELLRKTALGVGISRRFFIILEFQKTIGNDGTDFDMVCADLNSVAARVKSYMEQAGNIFLPACETDDGLHAAFYQILCRHKSETVPFSEHIEEILNGYMKESPDELPSINATEFFAPAWIDFTHHKHVVVDDKFYTFAYIPSYGYSQRVYAGWMSLFINASEGVDVDIFLTKIPKENIYNKIGMQVKLKRASASESHDTDSDYHQRLDTISSGEYMMLGLSGGEDFYYPGTASAGLDFLCKAGRVEIEEVHCYGNR